MDAARQVSAFRAFRTRLRCAFAGYRGPFVSIDVLLTWGTTKFAAVPVRHDPRRGGPSNYTRRTPGARTAPRRAIPAMCAVGRDTAANPRRDSAPTVASVARTAK